MQESFYNNMLETLEQSPRRMHICWINPQVFRPGCSLAQALGQPGGSALGRSLVMASPKHMAWTFDPGLLRLPVDPLSAYIFHDTSPPAFEPLLKAGRVVEWRVYGPDGNFPYLDSLHFVRSTLSRGGVYGSGCAGRFFCRDIPNREYVSPWATPLTPGAIARISHQSQRRGLGSEHRDVHFIGTVWHGNEQLFSSFALGCQRAGIPLHRHGAAPLPVHLRPLVATDDARNVPSAERDEMMRSSSFAVAVQGALHLTFNGKPLGTKSYIADRPLLAASMGMLVASNNEAVVSLFSGFRDSIAYHPNASELCRVGAQVAEERLRHGEDEARRKGDMLAAHMAQSHTYVSRFADMVDVIIRGSTDVSQARAEKAIGYEPDLSSQWCSAGSNWTRQLLEPLAPLDMAGVPLTFILGAQTAGIYDLVEMLTDRLGFCGVNTNFFEFSEMGDNEDVVKYRQCFAHCRGKPPLDMTPEYLYAHSMVAPRLAAAYATSNVLQRVRTIALIREPVTRLSAALDLELERCDGLVDDNQGRCRVCRETKRGNKKEAEMNRHVLCKAMRGGTLTRLVSEATRDAPDRCSQHWNLACQAIDYGLYARQLSSWLHFLPKERLLVLHYEDFVADETATRRRAYDKLYDFLGKSEVDLGTDIIGANERPGRYLGLQVECTARRFFKTPNDELVQLLHKTWPRDAPFPSERYNDALAAGRCDSIVSSTDAASLPWPSSMEMARRREQANNFLAAAYRRE